MTTSMLSPRTGNPVANQFIINNGKSLTFQSYETVIAKQTNKVLTIDKNALHYSQTTLKYLKEFLNTGATKQELSKRLVNGETFNGRKVVIKDLNK